MFHISDCKKYTRCPHLYLRELAAPKREFQPFVRLDEEITALAAEKLGVKNEFKGQKGDSPTLALEAMQQYDWLVKARFEYLQLRIKVPFLHRSGDKWDIYFLFVGLYPHPDDMQFYCDTVWVLQNLGINLNGFYMIHLNADYVRGSELDVNELFIITEYFYNHNNNPTVLIKDAIYDNLHDLRGMLKEMEVCDSVSLGKPVRTSRCATRQKCRYYEDCFPNEFREPDNSILTLISSQHKYAMKKEGRMELKNTDENRIEGFKQQYSQIMADKGNGTYVDVMGLRSWLSYVHYPITFLDFEWERFAVPPYEGMKPYDVLPFEYSIHILHEDQTMTHKVYLSVHDDRKDMAENLIRDIPPEGSVVAYNAEGAEKIRIRELADTFPQYAPQLESMINRMEDLQIPFVTGTVYNIHMRGQWSLKSLMEFQDDEGYRNLDIRQGMDAVFQWRLLDYSDENTDREKIINDLKAYCGMDSYAMVVVYKWLLELAEEDSFVKE